MNDPRERDPASSDPAGVPGRSLRPFLVLWSGQALSLVGSQAVQFALIWWITAQRDSATVLAVAAMIGLLPPVVLGPFIGAAVDRWNRKRVMLLADVGSALASAVLAWRFAVGDPGLAWIYGLLLVRAVAAAFHMPAMEASTTLMVEPRQLSRIQGLNQMLLGGLQIVAAPLGAVLFALLPMAGVMAVDMLTAVPAIATLLAIPVPQPTRDAQAGPTSLLRDVREGLEFIRRRPGHLPLLSMASAINLFLVPAFSLLPLLVSHRGGDAARLAWLTSTLGAGTLVGGILLGVWGGFRRRIVTTLVALVGLGLATVAVGLAPTMIVTLAAMALLGIAVSLTNGPIHAVLQATVTPDLQGRVFTLYGSLAGLTAPLGLALAAPVAETLGVAAWYLAGGVACVAMAGVGATLPSVLYIEGRHLPASAVAHGAAAPGGDEAVQGG